MTALHKFVLYGSLGVLGVSLLGPGLAGIFRPGLGSHWLVAETVDARNHLRALNAMMAAPGLLALWACWDLENARSLVQGLGVVMALLVIARLYSWVVDGQPGPSTLLYLAIEAAFAITFLGWPPPKGP